MNRLEIKYSLIIVLAVFIVTTLFPACQDAKESGESASAKVTDRRSAYEQEYLKLQVQLQLAQSDVPYLLLDLKRQRIEIRLRDAVVWEEPMQLVDADFSILREFSDRFCDSTNGANLRYLNRKQLFASQDKFSDSVLTVVSGVLRVDAQLMQRELPARFELDWGNELILRFRTEAEIKPDSGATAWLRDLFASMKDDFGKSVPVVEVKAERALTLYRVAHSGLPTLLIPDKL